MIDVALRLAVSDAQRCFELDVAFASDAPVVALYGPSGAGKSLTLQTIAGLLQPAAGHVRIGGTTLYDHATGIDVAAARRGVGYLFQSYALFPHLTVRQNVAFGLTSWWQRRPSAADGARVEALLDSFGLRAMADSRPATLSGGQAQRVALARALASAPRVLLLDEPFAALNPMLRTSLRAELAEVRRRAALPAILITHDVDDLVALADEVFLVEQGRITGAFDLRSGAARDAAALQAQLQPDAPARAAHPHEGPLRAFLQAPLQGRD